MILDNEFTGDMRVENEVISLQKAGFQVYVLCLNYGNKPAIEDFHGAKVIRIQLSLYLKKKMKGLCNTFIDPYSIFWGRHILKFIRKYDIRVIHAHDLYMLGGAFYANKRLRNSCKVVADLHENYPEALKGYKFTQVFPGNLIVSIPGWEKTEVRWLNQSDYIITVIEEAAERYAGLGIPREKIFVVANYVNKEQFEQEADPTIIQKFQGKNIATYIGGFDNHRGLETALRATLLIIDQIPDYQLVLVGAGRNEGDLKKLAHHYGIETYISFEGYQPPELLPSYILSSAVCLIPHRKTPHTDNTIPHKLFQYMLLGKPVLVSDCKPLERIVSETRAGLVFQSGNEHDFAEKITQLFSDPEQSDQMGKNGKRAVREKYNWEATANNLILLYNSILDKK